MATVYILVTDISIVNSVENLKAHCLVATELQNLNLVINNN